MRTNFRMEDKYITMIRGDTLSFNIETLDENGEPFTTDLDTAYFTCKSNRSDNVFIFQKTLGNGISKIDTGLYVVRVAPQDTKDIEDGKYYYDLQLSVNEDVFTVMKGILEIEKDITY